MLVTNLAASLATVNMLLTGILTIEGSTMPSEVSCTSCPAEADVPPEVVGSLLKSDPSAETTQSLTAFSVGMAVFLALICDLMAETNS